MKSVAKKLFVLSISAILLLNTSIIALGQTLPSASESVKLEDILSSYHSQVQDARFNSSNTLGEEETLEKIQKAAVNELRSAGYEAYGVNSDTFQSTQTALSTDLESLGLDPNYSYIIVASGESPNNYANAVAPASAGSSFTYTSDGITYTMRYLTINSLDDPRYAKATTVDLLKSSSINLIKNCLDTAISAVISTYSNFLGTVASICGLSVSMFEPAGTSTMVLHGGTSWTRVHTQVWNDYDNMWQTGSCVESVIANSFISGQYFSASTLQYERVPEDEKSIVKYSDKYSNYTWRKEQAVFGYTYNLVNYDNVGDVEYTANGKVVITHVENF